MAAPRKLSYRPDLFTFSTIDEVENAVLEFSGIVNPANVNRILRDVIEHEPPAISRLAISSLDANLFTNHFPINAHDFKASLASLILSQLSVFFVLAHKLPSMNEDHYALVKDAPEVLSFIAERIASLEADQGPNPATTSKRGKPSAVSQKTRKRRHAQRAGTGDDGAFDTAPFGRLGIEPPTSLLELQQARGLVLATQQSILQAYLDSLQLPAVLESVQVACLPSLGEAPEAEANEDTSNDSEPGVAVDIPLNDAFQPRPTVKFSTLYRKRVAGFGDWDINVAPQAEQDLRALSKHDKTLFNLLIKTLRTLSHGNFSPTNQEPVNAADRGFPIFKAQVADQFIVYHIDCISIDEKNEQQAIKIFGLYSDDQVSRGTFWDSMGHELSKRGEVYTQRCIVRHDSTKDGCFTPAIFPANDTVVGCDGDPQIPTDDTEQILSLLLKTIHLSEVVLRSIVENLDDVAFVLNISPEEVEIVEHDKSCYVLGRSGTGKTTTMLYKMLLIEASSLDASTRPVRQLFVTQSRSLADKVGQHFRQLLGGYRPAAVTRNLNALRMADEALISREERDNLRSHLPSGPSRFSELQDSDFPLFVSFEQTSLNLVAQLSSLIECDITARSGVENREKRVYLTFEKFKSEYFPHFSQTLTKGLDPVSLFSQFLGVILGSEAALTSKSSYLDRETYMASQSRYTSTSQKARTYDLFEKYLAEKRRRGDFDLADRTRMILEEFRKNGVPGQKIDYLYVDEVQDNLLVDVLLLRSICHNPNGLFWAGDTAQTISAGSSFRFQELKAFLYRVEERRKGKYPELSFAHGVPPKIFQLTTNYRSHTGIVNCARTVIETLTQLWPESIDKLHPETGTVDGLKPLFFENWDSENVQANQFLFGTESSGGRIDFGAQQCMSRILVRDKIAKEKLLREVGEVAIIMSLYDAKGLEFNDVLLYNFFADSNVEEAQWRVVLNMLQGTVAPKFDSIRHAGVCMELKFLYVAVTRARSNLWIADCSTKGEPMRAVWTSRSQIQNCTLGEDTPQFAISSTPEEWKQRGQELFDKRLYSNAKMCFERAHMPLEAAVCSAHDLQYEASTMPANSRQTKAKFLEAGEAFLACSQMAAEKADEARKYVFISGDCFERGGDIPRAIVVYTIAEDFSKVATLYRQLGKFDEAVLTIRTHPTIDASIVDKITGVARLFYFKKGQFGKAAELFRDDEEAQLQYLSDRGLHGERAGLLDLLKKFSAAAEIHLQEGKLFKAVELFIRDGNVERASACIAQGFWAALPFGTPAPANDGQISQLLWYAAQMDLARLSPTRRDEMSMFQAILDGNIDKLEALGRSFHAANNSPAALLCLDHYFTHRFSVRDLGLDALVHHLDLFFTFVRLLYNAGFNVDPAASSGAGQLFGFSKDGEDRFLISPNSVLRPADASTESCVISAFQLRSTFQTFIRERLGTHVLRENSSCHGHKIFEGPCLTFALFGGRCNRGECQQEHVDPHALTPESYSLRVRAHILQILVYQSVQFQRVSIPERGFWISRLYSVLNPASYRLGSPASLNLTAIPEAAIGFQVIGDWLRERAYALDFDPQLRFLTRLVETVQLAFQFDRRHAMAYLGYAPFMTKDKPWIYRRLPASEGQYVVSEFLHAVDDRAEWSLSAGVLFLRHVAVDKSLSIQIGLLCDIADSICGRLIVADRQRRGMIHDVTLPLSWLTRELTAGGGGFGAPRATNTCWIFVRTLAELLETVISGVDAEHLLFESKDLASPKIGTMIRNIFLSRLCRCLCLLVYNFRSDALRGFVLQSIASLTRDPSRIFPAMTGRFVRARDWSELAKAVRDSTQGSLLDEMVQLLHAAGHPPREMPNVRQIVYRHLDEIPQLLGLAPASVPCSTNQGPSSRTDADAIQSAVTAKDGEDEQMQEDAPVELPTLAESAPRSQQELDAAAILQKALLRALERSKRRQSDGSATSQRVLPAIVELFLECKRTVKIIDGSTKAERMYARHVWGPLQHLVHCLNLVHNAAQEEAWQIKEDFAKSEHQVWETLEERSIAVERTLQSVITFQKALRSTDEEGVHKRRDFAVLKQRVEETVTVLDALPFASPPGIGLHLKVVQHWMNNWAGSGGSKPTSRKPLKPRLNTLDDVEDMYADFEDM
ncbi:hypothetical protein C8F01DRAFT_1067163 [Mycena amicta]|nr:hypothetical protein C8F01DRAFT_1067163 [Mycena amicta]